MPTLDEQIAYLGKYRQHELTVDKRTVLCFAVAVAIPIVALSVCLLIDAVWNHSFRITSTRIFVAVVPAVPFSGALSYLFNRWWVSLTSRFYLFEGKLDITADRSTHTVKYWLCVVVHGLILLHFVFLATFPAIAVVFPATFGITPFE